MLRDLHLRRCKSTAATAPPGLGFELTALPRALHASGARQLTNRRCIPGHVSPPCHPLAEEECDHFVEESCRDAYRDRVLIAVNRVLKAEGRQVQYRKPGFKMPAGGEPDFGAYATTGPPDGRHTFDVGEAKASACRIIWQILGSGVTGVGLDDWQCRLHRPCCT